MVGSFSPGIDSDTSAHDATYRCTARRDFTVSFYEEERTGYEEERTGFLSPSHRVMEMATAQNCTWLCLLEETGD